MSSTRNKRKRPDPPEPPVARRTSRDARAAATDGADGKDTKNDGDNNNNNNMSNATTTTPKQQQQRQNRQQQSQEATAKDETSNASNGKPGTTQPEASKDDGTATNAPNGDDDASGNPSSSGKTEDKTSTSDAAADDATTKPLHANQTVDTTTVQVDPNPDSKDRQTQLQELIRYRSLLVSRLRLCKGAADKRIQETSKTKTSKSTSAAAAAKSTTEMTDEMEIQAHKEMCRLASVVAKKLREGETASASGTGSAEKRTSLSLRRGSSVGKRMNAALSSLAPGVASSGGGDASSATSPKGVGKTDRQGAPTAKAVHQQQLQQQQQPPPVTQSSSTTPLSSTTSRPTGSKSTTKTQKGHSSSFTFKQTASGGLKAGDMEGFRPISTNSKNSKSSTVLGSASAHMRSRLSSSMQSRVMRPPNMPRVQFPEARRLREERNKLVLKLQASLEKKSESRKQTESNTRPSPSSLQRKESAILISAALDERLEEGVWLPRRRKTHWDRLLREMKWAASDFIEERKWKLSTAAALSNAVETSVQEQTIKKRSTPFSERSAATANPSATTIPATGKDESEEPDDPMDEDPPSAKETETANTYTEVSSEEQEASEKIAKQLSKSIQQLSTASNNLESSEKSMLKDSKSSAADTNDESKDVTMETDDDKRDEGNQGTATSKDKNEPQNLGFDEISDMVDGLKQVKQRDVSKKGVSYPIESDSTTIRLTKGQERVLTFVESMWSMTPAVGALVKSLPISGVTIAICALLFENRESGPQLLICRPENMIRWTKVISDCSDLNPIIFSSKTQRAMSWAEDKSFAPTEGDVVLCDMALVDTLWSVCPTLQQIEFEVVCLDTRRAMPEMPSWGVSDDDSTLGSGDKLLDVSWWAAVNRLTSTYCNKRVVLGDIRDDKALESSKLGMRERFELMALQFSYLVGPNVFATSTDENLVPKRIIQWARQKDKRNGESKSERVERVLAESMENMTYSADSRLLPDNKQAKLRYEIRLCSMPPDQKENYASRCVEMRGVLSSTLEDVAEQVPSTSTEKSIFTALLELRHACLASRHFLDSIQSKLPVHDGRKRLEANPSQPDMDTAESLIRFSGKLSELARLLHFHCGMSVADNEAFSSFFDSKSLGKSKTPKNSKKGRSQTVIIVAALPIARQLISLMLSCLGMSHELLESGPFCEAKLDTLTASSMFGKDSNISIMSPIAIEKRALHVGIEEATTVVLMDEDWSGKGGDSIEFVLHRWVAAMSFSKSQGEVIRLACQGTIEESLFSSLSATSHQGASKKRTTSKKSNKVDDSEPFDHMKFNLSDLRGSPLSSVLSLKAIGPSFLSGGSLEFLSSRNADDAPVEKVESAFMAFLKRLSQCETRAARTNRGAEAYVGVAPPVAENITILSATSVYDLSCTPIRAFFESQTNRSRWTSSLPQNRVALTANPRSEAKTSVPPPQTMGEVQLSLNEPGSELPQVNSMDILGYTRPESLATSQTIMRKDYSVPTLDNIDGNQGTEPFALLPPQPRIVITREISRPVSDDGTPSAANRKRKSMDTASSEDTHKAKKTRSDLPTGPGQNATTTATATAIVANTAPNNVVSTGECGTKQGDGENAAIATRVARDPSVVILQPSKSHKNWESVASTRNELMESWILINDSVEVKSLQSGSLDLDRATSGSKSLDLVALFVKKERRLGGPQPPANRMQPVDHRILGLPPLASQMVLNDVEGSENGKKMKKKTANQNAGVPSRRVSNTAMKQVVPPSVSFLGQQLTSESLRHRMLSSFGARQFGTGLSMFESTSFRAASNEVERRLSTKLLQILVSKTFQEHGLGLPPSLVDILQKGDSYRHDHLPPVKEYSSHQRASLRRSLVSPCRVDFGPFESGYLSLPSGMTTAAPPRTRLGVSLPMGVKIPFALRDQSDKSWTSSDDELLTKTTVRFGLNWIVVARALSKPAIVFDEKVGDVPKHQRSARQCRDRWQQLVRNEPALAERVRTAEKTLRDDALKTRDEIYGSMDEENNVAIVRNEALGVSVLLKPAAISTETEANKPDKMDIDETLSSSLSVPIQSEESPAKTSSAPPTEKKKRGLSILARASKHRQAVPKTIPGVAPDGSMSQPVSSHPSHMQSVQSSMASKWSNGRTEMWPLQILDCADKFYAGKGHSDLHRPRPEKIGQAPPSNGSRRHQSSTQRPVGRTSAASNRLPPHRAPASPMKRAKNPGET